MLCPHPGGVRRPAQSGKPSSPYFHSVETSTGPDGKWFTETPTALRRPSSSRSEHPRLRNTSPSESRRRPARDPPLGDQPGSPAALNRRCRPRGSSPARCVMPRPAPHPSTPIATERCVVGPARLRPRSNYPSWKLPRRTNFVIAAGSPPYDSPACVGPHVIARFERRLWLLRSHLVGSTRSAAAPLPTRRPGAAALRVSHR